MKNNITLVVLAALLSLATNQAHASLKSGTFTYFDRYGLPPSPEPNDPKAIQFQAFSKKVQKGGILRIPYNQPIDLVFPAYHKHGLQVQSAPYTENLVYESLMRTTPSGEDRTLIPALAKSVTIDAETLTYVIHLQEGVKFSDGREFNAQSVVDSWNFNLTEIKGPGLESLYKGIFGNVVLKVLSPLELEVQFPEIPKAKQGDAIYNFLSTSIALPSSPRQDTEIPVDTVGTGAYMVTKATRGQVVLARRFDYWDKNSSLYNFDRVEISVFMDKAVGRQAFMAHILDLHQEKDIVAEPLLDSELGRAFYERVEVQLPLDKINTSLLHLNMSRPHLKDVRVRKALLLAFDQEGINHTLNAGRVPALLYPGQVSRFNPKGPATSPERLSLLADDPGSEQSMDKFGMGSIGEFHGHRDRLREAAKLLREAGYENKDGVLVKDGQPLELSVLILSQSQYLRSMGVFAQNLRLLGIQLNYLRMNDVSALLVELHRNNYDLMTQAIGIPRDFTALRALVLHSRLASDNGPQFYPKGTGLNLSNINSPALDNILAEMQTTEPSEPRYNILVEAMLRILSAQVPFIPMGDETTDVYYKAKGLCLPPVLSEFPVDTAYYGECP